MKTYLEFLNESFSLSDIKRKYKEFNEKYFDNELPNDIEIYTLKSVSTGGKATTNYKNNKLIKIGININYIDNENALDTILVHEMVHGLLGIRGINPKRAHGKEFNEIAKKIEKMSKLNLTGTHLILFHDVPDNIEKPKYYFILYTRNGKPTLKTVEAWAVTNTKDYNSIILNHFTSYFDKFWNSKSFWKLQKPMAYVYEVEMNTGFFMTKDYENKLDKGKEIFLYRSAEYLFRKLTKDKDNVKIIDKIFLSRYKEIDE